MNLASRNFARFHPYPKEKKIPCRVKAKAMQLITFSTTKCTQSWNVPISDVILEHLSSWREKLHVYIKRVPNWHDFFICEIMCIIIFTFHKFDVQNILLMLNIISQWSYHLTKKERQNTINYTLQNSTQKIPPIL